MIVQMGRKSVVAEELHLDDLDKVCLAFNLTEEQCAVIREAFEQMCTARKGKKKRAPSAYNIFIGECVPKETGPVTERFKRCARKYKVEKEKGKIE